ncbi:saccharopine dehydrogenase NADP-binding domain-containing protein [Aquidulcibacter sp.]|uniref:saccharopine dehydrogenase family protein n=1 Tax=Aquidulcibacter sp. TaxID=2052990 RepID=UPI0025BBE231|nr:saccharopine dehydrogenase NADP-binding domain-containing protein [Aquidulcibacter sp.]
MARKDRERNGRRVLVVGAGGSMTGAFLRAMEQTAPPDLHFDLRDLNEDAALAAAERFGNERARASRLDLFDEPALQAAAAGAAFVVNGAGPFHRTAAPVRRAAIAAKAHYFDIDDDVESAREALAMSEDAKKVGVALFVGCGASPGLTNVLALDLVRRLDQVKSIDVAWCVGDEGPVELGRSVIAHTLHMGAGDYIGWKDGAPVERRSFATARRLPLPGLKRQPFYECAHPEPVMLGTSFPQVADVTCWGTLHPAPLNGIIRGIAEAERAGRIDTEAAIEFLRAAIAGHPTAPSSEELAMEGVRRQIREGEISRFDYWYFIFNALLKRQYPTQAATAALACGTIDGKPIELLRYIDSTSPGSPLKKMEIATGCAEAAFFLEALESGAAAKAGCLFPELWIDPAAFYRRLDSCLPPGAGDWLGPVLCRPIQDQHKHNPNAATLGWQLLHNSGRTETTLGRLDDKP